MSPYPASRLHRVIAALARDTHPVVVGLDGRSGAGKSTLAAQLAAPLGAEVVEGDAFFAGGTGMHAGSPAERAADCIDRSRLRDVLESARRGNAAGYRPFDWDAFDGRLGPDHVLPRAAVYLVEGVYSCHPDLHDLLDLKVLITVDPETRERRLIDREGAIGPWERQWHEAEDWYFDQLMPPNRFDIVI